MESIKYNEIEVKIDYENKNVWLTQEEIAKLYKIDRSGISKYIKKIHESGLLDFDKVCAKFAHEQFISNNKSKTKIRIYNLEVIKAIGYKINSNVVNEFSNWVERLFKDYSSKNTFLMQKGYEIVTFIDNELQIDVNVDIENDTVWLTQEQISILFDKSVSTINWHIKNILNSELYENEVVRQFEKIEFNKKYKYKYNLDMILAVGYRVNSKRGIMFRKWSTNILKNHLTKGYSINEKRCLSCQENLVSLNNEVKRINNELDDLKLLNKPEEIFKEKLLYENKCFDGYAFIRKLFLSATRQIIIIDGYVSIEVLEMLDDINIEIIIYTYTNATITNKDIRVFSRNHNLIINRISNIHDRYLIIDDEVYVLGCSIKDIGKKTSTLIKLTSINKEKIFT